MKPILYFAHCPQTEAIEALNWTDGLTDRDKAITSRVLITALNNEILREMHFGGRVSLSSSLEQSRTLVTIVPVAFKIAEIFDGMDSAFCKGCIDYFNQY